MKLDPIEIATESSSSLFGRVAAVWLAAGSGLVLAAGVSGSMDAWALAGILLFLPFFLFGFAVGSGWWIPLTLPALGLLAWRAFRYIRGDGSGRELLSVGLLSFLICIRPGGNGWFIEFFLAGVAVWMLVQVYRQRA